MTTYTVRIFGHRGVTRIPTDRGVEGGTDSVQVLQQPYVWAQALTVTVSGGAVSSTAAGVPAGLTIDPTTMLRIEVPDGFIIGYEVNEGQRLVTATSASPRTSVAENIQFGPGYTLSVIDMTSAT